MITIVITICHMITAIADPVCHDLAVQEVPTMQACVMSQAVIADWKGKSIYKSDQWLIVKTDCVHGTYVPKNAI